MVVAAMIAPVPVAAQDIAPSPSVTASEALAAAREAYRVRPAAPPPRECEDFAEGGEIVVCGKPMEDAERYRIRSPRKSEAEYAAATMDKGRPRAPDLGPAPCVPSLLSLCAGAGRPLPRATLIDLAAIPEPPAGSDADLIARGEKVP